MAKGQYEQGIIDARKAFDTHWSKVWASLYQNFDTEELEEIRALEDEFEDVFDRLQDEAATFDDAGNEG